MTRQDAKTMFWDTLTVLGLCLVLFVVVTWYMSP